jgi:hypothetical protein
VAVDAGGPNTVLVSAARSPRLAHNPFDAESAVYRKTVDEPWRKTEEGLPEDQGTLAPVLTTNPAEPGVFYALSNRGVYRSTDSRLSWEGLKVPWTEAYSRHHQALVIGEA